MSAQAPLPTPIPRQAMALARIVRPLYRFFDWLYGSGYNPLYRSGTLAVGLLFVLLVTGLYLSLFYSVSQPYESVAQLQEQVWLGRWIRALHRYATVATIIAILFHVLQLLVQGKSWGPRTLAWVSGVVLVVMFFVSAWSGYVMVWDLHGQRVAMSGAKMLAVVPMLHDVVTAAFDGTASIPPGFFFMNLFLHVALPLVMIMFLWIHTARLSRAVWFPIRSIMIWSVVGLAVLSVLWSAPLLEKADLLRVIGRIPTDMTVGFWMSWLDILGIVPTWGILVMALGALTIVPWWWRPARGTERSISTVDVAACTGCTQCARDCPYEAIKMVPRADGKRLIAEIIPHHCVSCGICAAACADFAIGPPGRTASDQRARVQEWHAGLATNDRHLDMVLIACANNCDLGGVLARYTERHPQSAVYPVECCGCVHTEVIEKILAQTKGAALIGCPARNCFNRDGGDLLAERIFEKRVPFLDRSIDRNRLLITAFSEAESGKVDAALDAFHARLQGAQADDRKRSEWGQRARAVVASVIILACCAYAAQIPNGVDPRDALIRIAGVLPSFQASACHIPTEAEMEGVPLHMRPKEVCVRNPLRYELSIHIDGAVVARKSIADRSGRVDQPLLLEAETPLPTGPHVVRVELATSGAQSVECTSQDRFEAGEILLVHYERATGSLRCSPLVRGAI